MQVGWGWSYYVLCVCYFCCKNEFWKYHYMMFWGLVLLPVVLVKTVFSDCYISGIPTLLDSRNAYRAWKTRKPTFF